MAMRFALLVVIAACAASRPNCPVSQAAKQDRPFAWRVTGDRGTLILQATHQGAGPDEVSPIVWSELYRASFYIAEADELPPKGPWREALLLPPNRSLRNLLLRDDFEMLVRRLDADPDHVARMKPWTAFVALATAAYDFPDENINAVLLAHARARDLRTIFLDTWDQQTRYLDAAIDQVDLANAIADFEKLQCSLPRRLAAFRAGDDRWFINELRVEERHVHDRIERWLVTLRAQLERGGRGVVAVGIGQLVGPHGLLGRLAADGYRVARL